jgi:hypothetical protein
MPKRLSDVPRWAWWTLTIAVAAIVLLGYSGNLTSIRPVDRLLNPKARSHGQSAQDFITEIFNYCGDQAALMLGSGPGDERRARQTFTSCYEHSLDGAVERGYLTREEIATTRPDMKP